jgi:hypothetical protein
MRTAALQFTIIVLLGAVLAARGNETPTNILVSLPTPPAPPWYQRVAKGVTVTNLTPVAYFRGLLGMTPAERQRLLADKSAAEREQVLAKVDEYKALPSGVREERLRQTELHWYLLALLRLEPAQRRARLKEISPLYQPMILHQLAQWDQLPADLRKALLEKESFLRTYVQWQDHSTSAREDMLGKMPAEQQERWAQELNRWQAWPESRREELCDAFRLFFCLTVEERKETAQALSEAERRQMEQALQSYANLPSALQRQCVESFSKFAEMSPQERDQFLQNAAKWETMTESERKLWRTLVNRLPPRPPGPYWPNLPPTPPGMPWPPMPSQTAASGPGVTNLAKAAK